MHIVIDPDTIVRRLTVVAIGVALLHLLVTQVIQPGLPLTRLFDLGSEQNLPTWFSSLVWGVAALGGWLCAERDTPSNRHLWVALAGVLALLSLDEVATLHERAAMVLSENLPADAQASLRAAFWATSWPIVVGPVVLAIGVWMLVTFRTVLARSPKAMWLVSAGLGCAFLGGLVLETTTNLLNHESLEGAWQIEKFCEECLEMAGGTLIVKGLFAHAASLDTAPASEPTGSSVDTGAQVWAHRFVPPPIA